MDFQKTNTLFAQGKEKQAFRQLYRYFPKIRKLILSKGGSTMDAEDVFQEALLILHRKWTEGKLEFTSNPETYLFSVCRFLWKDEFKKRKHLPDEELDEELTSDDSDLADLHQKEKQIGLIEQALLNIGEKCLHLLRGFYFEKKSMKELAEQLDLRNEILARKQKYKCLEKAREKVKAMSNANTSPL
jgi:RNA polymerase sigma factor (sigma-70 family)